MFWEVLACELIIDLLILVVILGELLLLVPNAVLNDLGINLHREVVSFIREIIEARPEAKGLGDCSRRPATITKTLSLEPTKDRLA
jgi:hypothetical protein